MIMDAFIWHNLYSHKFFKCQKWHSASILCVIFYACFISSVIGTSDLGETPITEKDRLNQIWAHRATSHPNEKHLRAMGQIREIIREKYRLVHTYGNDHEAAYELKSNCTPKAYDNLKLLLREGNHSLQECNINFYVSLVKMYESEAMLVAGLKNYLRNYGLETSVFLPETEIDVCLEGNDIQITCYAVRLARVLASVPVQYDTEKKIAHATDTVHPCYEQKINNLSEKAENVRQNFVHCLSA